ncbi:MAG: alanine dehydrogenase [Flammeovirgaceae bacterium]
MGDKEKLGFSEIVATHHQIHPQEKLMMVKTKSNKPISLGIPCENDRQEKRLALRPEAVSILVNNGFDVIIETNAGEHCKHSDRQYSDQGARISYSHKEVFESDIVLKIAPPTLEEIEFMKPCNTLVSALQMTTLTEEYLHAINKNRITALGYELLQDSDNGLPLVRAMSEIAGSTVMLIAAEYLSSINDGKGIILGGVTGVPPTKVVIIGAGTVAEFAARAALGLGAEVKIFDNQIHKLHRIKERLGQYHIYTSAIDSVMLQDALVRADVAVGALRAENGRTPMVVTEDLVAQMKPDSVIIDVAIDHGGCFETSRVTTLSKPTFRKFDVIHYCVPNVASRVARTATTAISNIFTPLLLQVSDLGGVDNTIFEKAWFAKGVYAYRGGITNEAIAKKFKMKHKNLNLIIAAHMG